MRGGNLGGMGARDCVWLDAWAEKPMTDIVERLRNQNADPVELDELAVEAADEIESLRAEVAEERALRLRLIEAVERSFGMTGPN